MRKPKIVILGGGFGGVYVAQRLLGCSLSPKRWNVELISRSPHFEFKPLLTEVLARRLPPESITAGLDSLWTGENYRSRVAEVTGIELEKRTVTTNKGRVQYDYLVIALGGTPQRIPAARGAAPFALESLDDCLRLRERILELAHYEEKAARTRRQNRHTIAIIGAGPTGIEVAGELTHMLNGEGRGKHTLAEIVLIESSSQILSTWGQALRRHAEHNLKRVGIRLLTRTTVKRIDKGAIRLNGGRMLRADTVVWSGGLKGLPLYRLLGVRLNATDRIRVTPTLQLPAYRNVFAIGDAIDTSTFSTPVPQSAQAAYQQANLAATNIKNSIEERAVEKFRYLELGQVMPVGGRRAIASLMGLTFDGYTAWALEKSLFLVRMPGLANKLRLFDGLALEPLVQRGLERLGQTP